MELSQIQEAINNPKNTYQLAKNLKHVNRIKFHADLIVDDSYVSPYYKDYLKWVFSFLGSKEKQTQFKAMLAFPLRTTELVDKIKDEYLKVFEAKDSYKEVFFSDAIYKNDFTKYLNSINYNKFWERETIDLLCSDFTSFIVIDIKQAELLEPYSFVVNTNQVIDYSDDYLFFNANNGKYIFIDNEKYTTFIKVKNEYIFENEAYHNLGVVPFRKLWSEQNSPISLFLSHLDWLLYFETSKQNLDLYAAYPMGWGYESKCEFHTPNGSYCNNGFIEVDGNNEPCPACSGKSLVGAGTFIKVPMPVGEMNLNIPPSGFISVDNNSLTYNVSEIIRLKDYILTSATGKKSDVSAEAINEKQVQSQYDTQTTILNWIARGLEDIEKWTLDLMANIRYGSNYIETIVYYGSIFYLENENELSQSIKNLKEVGAPSSLITQKLNNLQYIATKHNQNEGTRIKLLNDLEPYPIYSLGELKNLGIDVIDKENYLLKANFNAFIMKFESEVGNIVEFGSAIDYNLKLEKINVFLKKYVTELLTKNKLNGTTIATATATTESE